MRGKFWNKQTMTLKVLRNRKITQSQSDCVILTKINFRCKYIFENILSWRIFCAHTQENEFLFLSKLNGIWSWWKFSLRLLTKWNSIGFRIERKIATTVVFDSISEESEIWVSWVHRLTKLYTRKIKWNWISICLYLHIKVSLSCRYFPCHQMGPSLFDLHLESNI